MQLRMITELGKEKESVKVNPKVFGAPFNESLIHQVVTAYQAGARAGSRAQKSRGEVRGGGAKPWRQKGTGRARAGTKTSPLWRGGGQTFAAKPTSFEQKVNRKMYQAAIRSILSELCRKERLLLVEDITANEYKTKDFLKKMTALDVKEGLIVVDEITDFLYYSAKNIPGIALCTASGIDPVRLLAYEKLVVTPSGIKYFEEWLQ